MTISNLQRILRGLLLILIVSALASCMVGPNFCPPHAPDVSRYNAHPLPVKTSSTPSMGKNAGKSQTYIMGQDISEDWWAVFHSPAINCLVNRGIYHSPNIASAYATLREAQETLNAQIGNSLFPAVTSQLNGQRERTSNASFGQSISSIFNLFNASINVSYTLDFFGGERRQIEADAAQVDYQYFQLLGAYLTLSSNIVTTAITIASLEAQIKTTYELIADEESLLHIIKQQYALGGVSEINVVTQATQVEQTKATLPPLMQNLAANKHALAVYVGTFPDEKMPNINLDALHLPKDLPVTIPSLLVRQRPDVRGQEALMHVASANIGVATANLLPQFTLSGAYGWESGFLPKLFTRNASVWNYGLGITQPIFQGGALLAQRREKIDAFQQAAAEYRQTVLQAFQNVADTLRALDNDAKELRFQRAAEIYAHKNFIITRQQYLLGGTSYLNLLTAEQQYQQTQINRIKAQAARYTDTAALLQALGGGWWHREWCVKKYSL